MSSPSASYVLDAFVKAYESALSNQAAAAMLAEREMAAQSTSLNVLALEEVGKMILIDGLLFARQGDTRYGAWKKGRFSHHAKLDALEIYPLFLRYLSTYDPRRDEAPYQQTRNAVFQDLKLRRTRLVELIGIQFQLKDLDRLKQKGFYSHEEDGTLLSNTQSIPPAIAKAIHDLAFRVTDSLRFVIGRSLEDYRMKFVALRETMGDRALQEIREQARQIVSGVLRNASNSPNSQ